MSYTVKFTPEAGETFDALSAQLLNRWGEQFVRKFEDRVSGTIETLSQMPFLYPIVLEELQVRKCVLHKNYSFFYKIINHTVVVCFLGNRQDPLVE